MTAKAAGRSGISRVLMPQKKLRWFPTEASRRNRRIAAKLIQNDFDAAVLRFAHAGAGWHQQVGVAKTLGRDLGCRHAIGNQLRFNSLRPAD
jgi:hypothetical protein